MAEQAQDEFKPVGAEHGCQDGPDRVCQIGGKAKKKAEVQELTMPPERTTTSATPKLGPSAWRFGGTHVGDGSSRAVAPSETLSHCRCGRGVPRVRQRVPASLKREASSFLSRLGYAPGSARDAHSRHDPLTKPKAA
jgi:hypothetical protein